MKPVLRPLGASPAAGSGTFFCRSGRFRLAVLSEENNGELIGLLVSAFYLFVDLFVQ
jgi:hypothetical protein